MVRGVLACCLIALTACSDLPEKPAKLDVFAKMDAVETIELGRVEVGHSAQSDVAVIDGVEHVVYPPAEAEQLILRLEALNANDDILKKAIDVQKASEIERKRLIEAGRLVEQRANWLQDELYATEAELNQSKRAHTVDNLLHRLLFLLAIGIGL